MPSTYAHYRLGKEASARLPERLRETVGKYADCFALGLHGPDLLFYYKPLRTNSVNAEGYAMHEREARVFFVQAKEIFLSRGERESDRAYLFGFLCHFALDSVCHPVVNEEMTKKSFTHAEVESAFDKFLLIRDGKAPFGTDTTAHIVCTPTVTDVASAYFGVAEKQAKKAVRSLKFYNRLLRTHLKAARFFLNALMKAAGCYEVLHGMMMPLSDDEKHDDGNRALSAAYAQAVEKAQELIVNYDGYLDGACEPSGLLNRNFE